MVMDQPLGEFYGSLNRFRIDDETFPVSSNQNLIVFSQNYVNSASPLDPNSSKASLLSTVSQEGDSHEDYDFSDVVLKYISQMLMEEDIEEQNCMFQESSAALQAAEKSLYELIGEEYPPFPNQKSVSKVDQKHESQDERHDLTCNYSSSIGCVSTSSLTDPGWYPPFPNHESVSNVDQKHESPDEKRDLTSNCSSSISVVSPSYLADPGGNSDFGEHKSLCVALQTSSQSSPGSANSAANVVYGFMDSPVSNIRFPDIFDDRESVTRFKRGLEEASKFLPNSTNLSVGLGYSGLSIKDLKEEPECIVVKAEKKVEEECSLDGSRGRKNPFPEDVFTESERRSKQSAFSTDSNVSPEMYDMVLLQCGSGTEAALREAWQNETNKNTQQNGQLTGTSGGKSRRKKQERKKDIVDLRTLVTLCAQAVGAADNRSASELLKQIRQHSSPMGDGMQRMAHYFAIGLEARLAGSGTEAYAALVNKPVSAADVLKGYHLFLAACPFRKMSNFFSNKTIIKVAEKATKLHIIDFGILYGFQWPCLIHRLSSRHGGPPRLRITGVDLPQPGFRPAKRVEEAGRRLANYANTFKVPFEFSPIAQKWDTIKIEDLKIESDEVLVVNCLYRFRNLLDESVVVDSPRNKVLNLIRKINPTVFILGIVNGTYNAPFFITRFREALFHYSTLFDMLETTVPREIQERMLVERELFGREVMNVIACEGAERIERPETYKQWQARNLRAGFRQLPLNEEIKSMTKERVATNYHKDFVIEEDSKWLLQGWKGRIVYALSSWVPAC
ncbi:scarecrow-like protein 14 [Carica papaya]|uniref:scarecrow-like protein 14 n=1 Tax=Carica papaya TaxID=3649 RepID=UPI000B8CCE11|nr:scarecrow-like protein 14 [Carica papaya]XP_021910424.1 scarecrow-like protein 14 [Carica papaya]XP_021910425.1 scarecrow-like protein 14 [Carica papaya]